MENRLSHHYFYFEKFIHHFVGSITVSLYEYESMKFVCSQIDYKEPSRQTINITQIKHPV